MSFQRSLALLVVVGTAACAAERNDGKGNDEQVGEARQATIADFTAGGCAGWTTGVVDYFYYGGSEYYDSVEVDGVLGHTFYAFVLAEFPNFAQVPWTSANIEACQANKAWVYLSKLDDGNWIAWEEPGYINAVALQNGDMIDRCAVTYFQDDTTFGVSTSLNVYVDGLGNDGAYPLETIEVDENDGLGCD